MRKDSFDGVWLRLAITEPRTCRIAPDSTADETSLCTPAVTVRSPALIEGGSIAYLTLTRLDNTDGQRRWELSATGHGPAGTSLTDRICDAARAWGRNRAIEPTIVAIPAGRTYDDAPESTTIVKPHTLLIGTY